MWRGIGKFKFGIEFDLKRKMFVIELELERLVFGKRSKVKAHDTSCTQTSRDDIFWLEESDLLT